LKWGKKRPSNGAGKFLINLQKRKLLEGKTRRRKVETSVVLRWLGKAKVALVHVAKKGDKKMVKKREGEKKKVQSFLRLEGASGHRVFLGRV